MSQAQERADPRYPCSLLLLSPTERVQEHEEESMGREGLDGGLIIQTRRKEGEKVCKERIKREIR